MDLIKPYQLSDDLHRPIEKKLHDEDASHNLIIALPAD